MIDSFLTQEILKGLSEGGGGGYAEAIIHDPTTTYAYSIGAGGTAGTAGTNGVAGTAGGSGVIRIECHYQ